MNNISIKLLKIKKKFSVRSQDLGVLGVSPLASVGGNAWKETWWREGGAFWEAGQASFLGAGDTDVLNLCKFHKLYPYNDAHFSVWRSHFNKRFLRNNTRLALDTCFRPGLHPHQRVQH